MKIRLKDGLIVATAESEEERQEVASWAPSVNGHVFVLHHQDARLAGREAAASDTLEYERQTVRVGTSDHWHLMYRASLAKFSQHAEARLALVATAERPLQHRTRRESRTIPGVVMADIWMRVRRALVNQHTEGQEADEDAAGGI